jgi:hypothetical protein
MNKNMKKSETSKYVAFYGHPHDSGSDTGPLIGLWSRKDETLHYWTQDLKAWSSTGCKSAIHAALCLAGLEAVDTDDAGWEFDALLGLPERPRGSATV